MDPKGTVTFRAWVSKYPDQERDRLARRAIKDVPDLVLEVVAHEIDHCRRLDVEVLETRAHRAMMSHMAQFTASGGTVSALADDIKELFAELLAQRFALGDGVKVAWGEATIEQHEQRVHMLRGLVNGTLATIKRHEEAVERLRSAGAKCLNELMETKAA